MNKSILIIAIAGILVIQNYFDARSEEAESGKTAISNVSPSEAVHGEEADILKPAIVAQQLPAKVSIPKVQTSQTNESLSATSLTQWKEILSANNQVVNQVASMYQHFGLFLTIIVTLVGGIATWLSVMAKRSVNEFIKEWTDKMKLLESEIKNSMNRLHEAVAEAEGSAKKAATHEQTLQNGVLILNQALQERDRLRENFTSQHTQKSEEQSDLPSSSAEATVIPPPTQSSVTDEDAEVSALLKDKIDLPEGEGNKS
jgi:hypothetical protein